VAVFSFGALIYVRLMKLMSNGSACGTADRRKLL
jgi:hypothetical protein